jgi:hypothetical protein
LAWMFPARVRLAWRLLTTLVVTEFWVVRKIGAIRDSCRVLKRFAV